MEADDWTQLGEFVANRIDELGIDQAELVRRSGLSQPTIKGVMDGGPRGHPRRSSLRKLEDGLGWQRGSVADILAGGEPVVAGPPADSVSQFDVWVRLERLEDVVRQLLRVTAANDRTTEEILGALSDQMQDEHQESPTAGQ